VNYTVQQRIKSNQAVPEYKHMTPSQGITSLYTYSIGINSTSGNNTNQQLYQEHA